MIPALCAASSASAICCAKAKASVSGNGHQGWHVVGVFETVDCPDVRMIERCEQLCFAFEARYAIGVLREQRRQELQRDVAPKLSVAGAIHLPHAASA